MIHHAVLSSRRNSVNARLVIFSPDTDVLVLAVANHHLLLRNTSVSMVSGVIDVEPIARALGRQMAHALPALHAFSGADTVGKFNHLGKATWMNIFMKSGSDTIGALEQLLTVNETSEQQLAVLASFVCAAYCPKGIEISGIPELRWYLYCKHIAESNRLPPTDIGSPHTAHFTCPYPSKGMGTGQYRTTGVLRSIAEWILQRRQWGPGTAYNC